MSGMKNRSRYGGKSSVAQNLLTVLVWVVLFSGVPFHTASAQLCEEEDDTWTLDEDLSMPESLDSHQLAMDNDGRIYLVSGVGDSGPTSVVLRFDEDTGLWEEIAPMSTARASAAVASDSDGRIYAIAGNDGVSTLDTVERYDPETDEWSSVASLPEPRGSAKAVSNAAGDAIFVIGGGDEDGEITASVFRYDVSEDEWSTEPSMVFPRTFFGAARGSDDMIYAVGGEGVLGAPSPDDTGGTAEVRDPDTGEWSEIASLDSHPHQVGAVVADECGFIYAIGGWNPGYTSAVERYDPDLDEWEDCASLDGGRNNMDAIQGDSGEIYAIGGDASFAHVDTVEFALGCTVADADGDGVPDDEDVCPESDLSETVVIGDEDSSVDNTLLDNGCTISDLIQQLADEAETHGEFVRLVATLTNQLKAGGVITGLEKGKIQGAAGRADVP